ncbi:MAG: DUF1156 domain-containing protein [Candidatus Heimdallarchaeota archaeon]
MIENDFPLAINREVKREKPAVMRTPASLHLWWARRPITLCRAVIAASLLPGPGKDYEAEIFIPTLLRACTLNAGFDSENEDIRILRSLVNENWPNKKIYLLDQFAGGGSIPLEGLRLGLNVYARDLNPVSYLVRECGLKLIPQFPTIEIDSRNTALSGTLEDQVRKWALKIEKKVKNRLNNPLNPQLDIFGQEEAISYLWVKTGLCVVCGSGIPLLSLTKLRTMKEERVYVGIAVDHDERKFRLFPTASGPMNPFLSRKYVFCPFCKKKDTTLADIKKQASDGQKGLGISPIAKILPSKGKSRRRIVPMGKKDLEYVQKAKIALEQEMKLGRWINCFPNEEAPPETALGCITAAYGMNTFDKFFSARQTLVLANFAYEISTVREFLLDSTNKSHQAKTIVMCLAFALDRLADYNSLLTSWHVSKQIIRNTFPAGQLRMTWDFVEANPFTPGSGSWSSAIRTTIAGTKACSSTLLGNLLENRIGSATELPYSSRKFDLIVTDPPYYDNMAYSYISDFFYVWLKRTIGPMYPEAFLSALTPRKEELIVSGKTKRERKRSHRLLEEGLTRSFREAHRVLKPNGMMIVMFTHSSFSAWAQMIRCIRAGNFKITSAWPVSSELRSKIAPGRSNILVSIILACRPNGDTSGQDIAGHQEIRSALRDQVRKRGKTFANHFNKEEYCTAMIAPALEVYSRIPSIDDPDGRVLEELYIESLKLARY